MVFGKVKFPELDKSQAEILGIAGEEGGKIQFQSLETGRRVLILLTTSDDDPKTGSRVRVSVMELIDPPHDPNKIHCTLAGLPRDVIHKLDMEDMGIETQPLEKLVENNGTGIEQPGVTALNSIIGSAWLKTEIPTRDNLGHARLALAIMTKSTKQWTQIVLGSAADFVVTGAGGGLSVDAIVKAACVDLKDVAALVPVLQPKRVVDEKGRWYFVG